MEETHRIRSRKRAPSRVREKPTASANALAYSLTSQSTPANMDLKADVAGYTHRGGFKLRISNIETLTDDLIQSWKTKCGQQGFECTIAYNAALSTAILHASKPTKSNSLLPEDVEAVAKEASSGLKRPHPLTLLAALLFLANAGRHLLSSDTF